MPYLRAKAQDYFEELGGGVNSEIDETLDTRQILALTDQVRISFLILIVAHIIASRLEGDFVEYSSLFIPI